MSNVNLPNLLQDGVDTALGSQVYANDAAIRDVVNGQLDSANLAAGANIKGSQLSSADPIPTSKLALGCVDATILRADATPTSPGAAVGSANHIKDGVITKAKFDPASKWAVAQLAISSGSGAWGATAPSSTAVITGGAGGSSFSVCPVNIAGNWKFRVDGMAIGNPGGGNAVCKYTFDVDPNLIGIGTLPVASKLILGAWVRDFSFGGGMGVIGTLYVVYIDMT